MDEGLTRRTVLRSAAAAASLNWSPPVWAAPKLSIVPQPYFASVRRAISSLHSIGEPISPADSMQIDKLANEATAQAVVAAESILAKYTIADVTLVANGHAITRPGRAPKSLVEQGWSAFLVRVNNPLGLTAKLKVIGGAASISSPATGASKAGVWDTLNLAPFIEKTWFRNELYQLPPIGPTLSGGLEYQVLQIYSRDHGSKRMELAFWTFDDMIGSAFIYFDHAGAMIDFQCLPAREIALGIKDYDGRSCVASLLIKDSRDRVYPLQALRLAPDLYFQPQIYRADGEAIRLPDGEYVIEARRGPEYLVERQHVRVAGGRTTIDVKLNRWINPADWGWYSGDTHVHTAGCAHYEHPTEGVAPETMIRQIRGEGLSIAEMLVWGNGYYHQKEFFTGHAISPPADLEEPKLQIANNASWAPQPTQEDKESTIRYDMEVSGFPSSHSGHLVLLNLKDENYPGANVIEEWPSWNLPILKWARAQGATIGFAHCGDGMNVASQELPNYLIPPMDMDGAYEAVVDVVHGLVDFLSACDGEPIRELNIWYHLLNCGFQVPMLGETDFPCVSGERPGVGRSYVQLEQRPTGERGYQDWLAGLKSGNLYFGDGRTHFLRWTVRDSQMGGKVKLAKAGLVEISALVAARLDERPHADSMRPSATPTFPSTWVWHVEKARIEGSRNVSVELIANGKVVDKFSLLADGTPRTLQFRTYVEQSSWLALRVFPSGHTTPVFVEVGSAPVRASSRSAKWCRQFVDKLWELKSPMIRDTERPAAAEAYEFARRSYDRIIAESYQA